MIEPGKALRMLLEMTEPSGVERVEVPRAIGRVTANDVVAREDVPACPRALVEGFLLHPEDCRGARPQHPVALDLAPGLLTGRDPADERVPKRGSARFVAAGASLPDAGLAVLPPEMARVEGNRLFVEHPVRPGLNIAGAASGVRRHTVILEWGEVVTPPAVAAMAVAGINAIDVFRRPRVGLVSVGDVWRSRDDHQVKDGNLTVLAATVEELGCDVVHAVPLPDDRALLRDALAEALGAGIDILLVTGEGSPLAREHIQEALRLLGARRIFGTVDIRPASAFFGGIVQDTWVLGLVGSPSASLAVFTALVRPVLLKLTGRRRILPRYIRARLLKGTRGAGDHPRLIWAELRGPGPHVAVPLTNDPRGRLIPPVAANALLVLPRGTPPLTADQFVWALRLDLAEAREWPSPGGEETYEHGQRGLFPTVPPAPRVLAIYGQGGATRRELVDGLIHELNELGMQVATVRHTAHSFEDTLFGAGPGERGELAPPPGAASFALVSADANLFYDASDLPLSEHTERLGRILDRMVTAHEVPDVVLVEGFGESDLPKIWIGPPRPGRPPRNVIAAIKTDDGVWAPPDVPVFLPGQPRALVEYLFSAALAGAAGEDDYVG